MTEEGKRDSRIRSQSCAQNRMVIPVVKDGLPLEPLHTKVHHGDFPLPVYLRYALTVGIVLRLRNVLHFTKRFFTNIGLLINTLKA